MPLPKALDVIGLKGRIPSRSKLVCPGFPKDSCFYVAFDGNFEGHYNRLYFVLDRADQVLCVELADEKPDKRDRITPDKGDWHTYDFVNGRKKATPKLFIEHKIFYQSKSSGWSEVSDSGYRSSEPSSARLFRIDTVLFQPYVEERHASFSTMTWKPLEDVRWYVPKPLSELILYCISRSGAGI